MRSKKYLYLANFSVPQMFTDHERLYFRHENYHTSTSCLCSILLLLRICYLLLIARSLGIPTAYYISSQAQVQAEAVDLCILASFGAFNQERIEFEFSRKPDPALKIRESKRKEGKNTCFLFRSAQYIHRRRCAD